MNRAEQYISEKFLRKKLFVSKYTNTENVEIFHVLHNQGAPLMKRHSEWGTRNCLQVIFRKVWTIHIENVDQKINLL